MSKKTWSTILVVVLIIAAAVGIYFATRPAADTPPVETAEPIVTETAMPTDEVTSSPSAELTPEPSLEPQAAVTETLSSNSAQEETAQPLADVLVAADEKAQELSSSVEKSTEDLKASGEAIVDGMEDKAKAAKDSIDQTIADIKEKSDVVIADTKEKVDGVSQNTEDKLQAAEDTADEALRALSMDGQKVKASIWHTFTKDQEQFLEKTVADFNAAHENYEIVLLSQPYEDFLGSVRSAVVEGIGPDIIFNYASEAAGYVKPGLVADLGQYIYDDEIGIKDFEGSLVDGVMNGEVKAFEDGLIHYLPAYTTGPIFFYNKTLFEELDLSVPTTWEEMEKAAKVIYDAKGIAIAGFDDITDIVQMLIMETPDGGYIDVSNQQVLFDTPEVRAKLEWLVDMVEKGYFRLKPTGNYFSEDFNSGIVAGFIGSSAGYPYITPADGKFEFAMAPIPAQTWFPSWNRGPIVFYYKDDARAQAAYEFVKYFISPEVNAGWTKSVVALAPYSWTKDNDAYKSFLAQDTLEAQALQAVEANLSVAGSLPAVQGANVVRNAIKTAVEKAALGDMSVDEAWTEAVTISNAALKDE
ncbi:MAG: extracellular solute-binding protein [Clostridiales bacterium]|nr:extracellular solute-binding protein [Clostridiales bacterium]